MPRRSPLFTDLYQLTMAQAYLDSKKSQSPAVFELFFRQPPFSGEYAIFAGLDAVKEIVDSFEFSKDDIHFLQTQTSLGTESDSFFDQLLKLRLNDIEIFSMEEGQLAFPRVPLLQLSGPLYKLQLLETALLNAVNYSTLVATYARRIRQVAGERKLIEFGMRRAQGPNGAMTASRSSFLGGFDGTSNVLAGKEFGIPLAGTMAHSFVQSFRDVPEESFEWERGNVKGLLEKFEKEDGLRTNRGELGAFLSYAKVFPQNSLLLVDTYNTLNSGVPNAIRIFKILRELGYPIVGIRLDSGDLVYLSQQARLLLDRAGFPEAKIFATNELSENIIDSLQKQGAKIDAYGVGTHLVTCLEQPALGGVYKLVEIDGHPRLKRSEQTEKTVLPCRKQVYRLYGKDGRMISDLICLQEETPPQVGREISALHPFDPFKRAVIVPHKVEALLQPLFQNGKWLRSVDLHKSRQKSLEQMAHLRPDICRRENPTPYKVSVSPRLKESFERLYFQESPPAHLE